MEQGLPESVGHPVRPAEEPIENREVLGGPEAGTGTECSADCMAIPG